MWQWRSIMEGAGKDERRTSNVERPTSN